MKLSRQLSISLFTGLILSVGGIGAIAPDTSMNERSIFWLPNVSHLWP